MRTTVRCSICIERPSEQVAAVLLDPDKAVLWTTDLERCEPVYGVPGHVGSKARLHYAQKGRRYVMEDLLLAVEPNRRYLSRVSGDTLEAEVETILVPVTGGTQVDICWRGSGTRVLARFVLPFMRRAVRRQAEVDLRKLKALVERS